MEDALFDLDDSNPPRTRAEKSPAHQAIGDVEVAKIRTTFLQAKITEQNERKRIIEISVPREVSSLKDLLSHEVPRVIYTLNDIIVASQKSNSSLRSAWDDREEDTWIDKL